MSRIVETRLQLIPDADLPAHYASYRVGDHEVWHAFGRAFDPSGPTFVTLHVAVHKSWLRDEISKVLFALQDARPGEVEEAPAADSVDGWGSFMKKVKKIARAIAHNKLVEKAKDEGLVNLIPPGIGKASAKAEKIAEGLIGKADQGDSEALAKIREIGQGAKGGDEKDQRALYLLAEKSELLRLKKAGIDVLAKGGKGAIAGVETDSVNLLEPSYAELYDEIGASLKLSAQELAIFKKLPPEEQARVKKMKQKAASAYLASRRQDADRAKQSKQRAQGQKAQDQIKRMQAAQIDRARKEKFHKEVQKRIDDQAEHYEQQLAEAEEGIRSRDTAEDKRRALEAQAAQFRLRLRAVKAQRRAAEEALENPELMKLDLEAMKARMAHQLELAKLEVQRDAQQVVVMDEGGTPAAPDLAAPPPPPDSPEEDVEVVVDDGDPADGEIEGYEDLGYDEMGRKRKKAKRRKGASQGQRGGQQRGGQPQRRPPQAGQRQPYGPTPQRQPLQQMPQMQPAAYADGYGAPPLPYPYPQQPGYPQPGYPQPPQYPQQPYPYPQPAPYYGGGEGGGGGGGGGGDEGFVVDYGYGEEGGGFDEGGEDEFLALANKEAADARALDSMEGFIHEPDESLRKAWQQELDTARKLGDNV